MTCLFKAGDIFLLYVNNWLTIYMYNSITNLHTVCETRCDSSASTCKYLKYLYVYVTLNNLLIIWNCAKELNFMAWHAEKSFFKPKITPPARGSLAVLKWIIMRWDGIWCILRHNFEKCYSVFTDLVASGWFFQYSYFCTVMITIFLGGSWAFFFLGGGGRFYTSNALGRTLVLNRTTSWRFSQFLLWMG